MNHMKILAPVSDFLGLEDHYKGFSYQAWQTSCPPHTRLGTQPCMTMSGGCTFSSSAQISLCRKEGREGPQGHRKANAFSQFDSIPIHFQYQPSPHTSIPVSTKLPESLVQGPLNRERAPPCLHRSTLPSTRCVLWRTTEQKWELSPTLTSSIHHHSKCERLHVYFGLVALVCSSDTWQLSSLSPCSAELLMAQKEKRVRGKK